MDQSKKGNNIAFLQKRNRLQVNMENLQIVFSFYVSYIFARSSRGHQLIAVVASMSK